MFDCFFESLPQCLHHFSTHQLTGLGLARVQDTFVGDQDTVRGVSGGEKRRVTVAEMGVTQFPVLCADEISTGLDGKFTPDCVSFHSRTLFLSLTRELCSSCHHLRYCSAHGTGDQTSELHQNRIAASAATRDFCTVRWADSNERRESNLQWPC
jgi:ABC-type thiamine transport system ATPase subunit